MSDPTEGTSVTELVELGNKAQDFITDTTGTKSEALGSAIEALETEESEGYDWSEASDLIDATGNALTTFMDPDSNGADMVSAVLEVGSALAGALVSTASLFGPVGFVLGLAGAVLGAFGSRDTTNYAKLVKELVDDSIATQELDDGAALLGGVYDDLQSTFDRMAQILDDVTVIEPGSDYASVFSLDDVDSRGVDELGQVWTFITKNTASDRADEWDGVADLIQNYARVAAYRIMYLVQATAYFKAIADGKNNGDDGNVKLVLGQREDDQAKYAGQLSSYLIPNLTNGGVTCELFRTSKERFDAFLALAKRWGVSPWPRGISLPGKTKLSTNHNLDGGDDNPYVLGVERIGNTMGYPATVTWTGMRGDFDPIPQAGTQAAGRTTLTLVSTDDDYRFTIGSDDYASEVFYQALSVYVFEVVPSSGERSTYGISGSEDDTLLIIGVATSSKREIYYLHDEHFETGSYENIFDDGRTNKRLWKLVAV